MTNHQISSKRIKIGATNGAGITEFTHGACGIGAAQTLVFCLVLCRSLFVCLFVCFFLFADVVFLLAMKLSVPLRFTAFDYLFCILTLSCKPTSCLITNGSTRKSSRRYHADYTGNSSRTVIGWPMVLAQQLDHLQQYNTEH